MNLIIFAGLVAATLAAAASTLAFPLVARIAMAIRAMDYPGGRRVHSEAIPLFRKQRSGIAIHRKLYPGLDADGAVHAENAGAEKHLVAPAAGQRTPLPLQGPRSLPGEFPEDAPVPARVIGPPGERPVAVYRRLGQQVRKAIAVRFRGVSS